MMPISALRVREKTPLPNWCKRRPRIGFFVVDALTVTCPASWPGFVPVDPSRSSMAAALIAHAIINVNRTTIRLVVATKSSSRENHARVLTLLRNVRRLFTVEISSLHMECRRQGLAHEFTLI